MIFPPNGNLFDIRSCSNRSNSFKKCFGDWGASSTNITFAFLRYSASSDCALIWDLESRLNGTCNLNLVWHVRPPLIREAAIPVQAVGRAI